MSLIVTLCSVCDTVSFSRPWQRGSQTNLRRVVEDYALVATWSDSKILACVHIYIYMYILR